jgi:hypothetical protein
MAGTAKIVMIPTDIDIKEFIDRVAAKFAVTTRRLKCTFREEDGSMMDLSDQDELETLIELAKEDAKLNRREFGRAEVCHPIHILGQRLMMTRLHVLHEVTYTFKLHSRVLLFWSLLDWGHFSGAGTNLHRR